MRAITRREPMRRALRRAAGFSTAGGTVMCNGVWDLYHAGHPNAWLQAKIANNASSVVVAVHDSADVLAKHMKRVQ